MTNDRSPSTPPPGVGDGAFGEYYYGNCCGKPYLRNDEWLAFFGGIADRIIQDIGPRRVLDAGCAMGFLVEALRDRHTEAYGIDASSYAIEHLHEKVQPFCRRGSIADELDDRYDVFVCIEVAEHMPAANAEAAIANLYRHTDDVLFSSSPLDHKEPTHINVHPPEHWAELFARHDFFRDTDFDASFVTAWAGRFRRRREPVHRVIRGYERRHWELLTAANDAHEYSTHQQRQVETLVADARRSADHIRELEAMLADARRGAEVLAAVRQTLSDTQHALAQANDTVFHMERSRFWKARGLWIRLRSLVSGRT